MDHQTSILFDCIIGVQNYWFIELHVYVTWGTAFDSTGYQMPTQSTFIEFWQILFFLKLIRESDWDEESFKITNSGPKKLWKSNMVHLLLSFASMPKIDKKFTFKCCYKLISQMRGIQAKIINVFTRSSDD